MLITKGGFTSSISLKEEAILWLKTAKTQDIATALEYATL